MPSATTSMLIFGLKLVIGAKRVSSPKGFRNGAWGGCARVALDASSMHRNRSEANNANNDRTRNAISCSFIEVWCEHDLGRLPDGERLVLAGGARAETSPLYGCNSAGLGRQEIDAIFPSVED